MMWNASKRRQAVPGLTRDLCLEREAPDQVRGGVVEDRR